MSKYESNNPKRRIAKLGYFSERELDGLASVAHYEGSAHHKTRPADYGFTPPVAPRYSKCLCDGSRVVSRDEAQQLLLAGIRHGMVSRHFKGDLPKYVWAVDDAGEVYEAKLGGHNGRQYHGYQLPRVDVMYKQVKAEWSRRNAAD